MMNVKELRESNKMTQMEVIDKAKEMGYNITQPMLSAWEQGKQKPSAKNEEALKEIFGEDTYSLGYRFAKNCGAKLKDYRALATKYNITNSRDDKLYTFCDLVIAIATDKEIPIPNIVADIFDTKDTDREKKFFMGMWNGLLENNNS